MIFLTKDSQAPLSNINVSNISSSVFFRTLCSIFDVSSDILEFCENFGEESCFGIDPEHRVTQLIYDFDASVPKPILICLNQKRFQRVADLIAHVTEKKFECEQRY